MDDFQKQMIADFIINGTDNNFNLFKQREFIAPLFSERQELYDYLLFVAIKNYGLNIKNKVRTIALKRALPEQFLFDCNSFEKAQYKIAELRTALARCTFYNDIFKCEETLADVFWRVQVGLTGSSIGGGEMFYSSKLRDESNNTSHRLYIPCNSDCTYRFARLLIEKSKKYDLPFEFKVMNVADGKNGADNIVMYIRGEDFSKHIKAITEIISENPNITFGNPHMFGCLVNEHVAIAPEIGGMNSYSGYIQDFLKEAFLEYGRTSECASVVIKTVNDILLEYGLIDDIETFKQSRKEEKAIK